MVSAGLLCLMFDTCWRIDSGTHDVLDTLSCFPSSPLPFVDRSGKVCSRDTNVSLLYVFALKCLSRRLKPIAL